MRHKKELRGGRKEFSDVEYGEDYKVNATVGRPYWASKTTWTVEYAMPR